MNLCLRPTVALLLAGMLLPALRADEAGLKWSGWHAIDDRFSLVRMRTARDDNDGAGWGDGQHHWRVEIKNNTARSIFRVSLEYPRWVPRTKTWAPAIEPTPPGVEIEPGDVYETTAVSESKGSFDFRYLIVLVPAEGKTTKTPRSAAGYANSRFETGPIPESSLVTQAAFAKATAEERKISTTPGPAPEPAPAANTQPAIGPSHAEAAPVPASPPSPAPAAVLPVALPAAPADPSSLPPASVEGLGAAERVALWQQRAAQGDVSAMFELGRACRMGEGTPRDHVLATKWYRQAANRGSAAAMTKLGYAYDSGLGVTRDADAALGWWRKAASLGDADAMAKLAKLGVKP